MKQELLQLAKFKGFESKVIGKSVESVYILNKDLYYYLWMCELQRWLILNHKILVDVTVVDNWDSWDWKITIEDLMSPLAIVNCNLEDYSTQLLALEAGLLNALKLIQNDSKN